MRMGFYFDMNSCIGCRTCQVACKDRNGLEVGYLFRRVDSFEVGTYPNARLYHFSHSCNHCEVPACIADCPTKALYKAEDGTVQYDVRRCIGCGTCTRSCPYEVPKLIASEGIMRKCDACAPFRAAGKNPVCVDACPMRCLKFGDVDELRAQYGEGLVTELPITPPAERTEPATLINPKPCALEEGWRPQAV